MSDHLHELCHRAHDGIDVRRPGRQAQYVPSIAHDEDERPSREDMDYRSTIFSRPTVPMPRFLRGGKKPPPR
jgi:hypothetical protein